MTAWRHVTCQKVPKGMQAASELDGFAALTAEQKETLDNWVANQGGSGGKKRSAEELEAVAKKDPKKMKAKEMDSALNDFGVSTSKKSKAEKKEAMEEVIERAAIEARYAKLSVPQLKEMLGLNKQLKGGTKAEVLARCVDGKIYGALPKCPKCGGGTLKVFYTVQTGHNGQGKYSCPGYFDDDTFKRCNYTAESAERLPWQES